MFNYFIGDFYILQRGQFNKVSVKTIYDNDKLLFFASLSIWFNGFEYKYSATLLHTNFKEKLPWNRIFLTDNCKFNNICLDKYFLHMWVPYLVTIDQIRNGAVYENIV